MPILDVISLQKIYTTRFGGNQVQALSNVSFSVEQGEYVAIMGESGSGKTTLLNILAALDQPTAGQVLLNGKELSGIRERDADGKISLNQQKPSKHAGLRRFGPEKFLQRNNEFMKERPIFYKKPIKTEKDFSTWLRCFYYTTKAVITEYIYF